MRNPTRALLVMSLAQEIEGEHSSSEAAGFLNELIMRLHRSSVRDRDRVGENLVVEFDLLESDSLHSALRFVVVGADSALNYGELAFRFTRCDPSLDMDYIERVFPALLGGHLEIALNGWEKLEPERRLRLRELGIDGHNWNCSYCERSFYTFIEATLHEEHCSHHPVGS